MSVPKTEREKMLANELYLAADAELTSLHVAAHHLLHTYNVSQPSEDAVRRNIMLSLFGKPRL